MIMSKEFQWTNELLQEWGVFFMKDKTRRPYDELVEAFKQSWVATHPIKKKDYEIVEFISPRGGKITKNNDNVSWDEVKEVMDAAYNQAIDHCMEIVKQYYDEVELNFPPYLMSRLNELKKL